MEERAIRNAAEVRLNHEAFLEQLPALLAEHRDQYALLSGGAVVGFFKAAMEAYEAGEVRFGIGNFSIQKITDRPIDLGYFSHAPHP